MKIFDTNAVLRYILRDNIQMADAVEEVLSKEDCLIPVEVIAETVYVLNKVYKIEREPIKTAIEMIANIDNHIIEHQNVVTHALKVHAFSRLDFVDCLLVGYSKVEGYEIFTFDKKLKNRLKK